MADFAGKGKVAVLKTTPESVLEDVENVMRLGQFESALPKDVTTGLKINISWQTWYPACSSTPWQIEGVIGALQNAGYKDLVGVHNDTVVVDTTVGEFNNKHRFVTDKHKIPCLYLYEQDFDRDSNTIEVFIGRLRKKIPPDMIKTIRGLGYRLSQEGDDN